VFESSRFVTTERKKSHTTALALRICISISLLRFSTLANTIPGTWILHLLWWIAAYMQRTLRWVSGETKYFGLFGANFHSGSVARSRKPIECMLKTLINASSSKSSAKNRRLFLQLQLWHPIGLGCDYLPNSCFSRPGVTNLCTISYHLGTPYCQRVLLLQEQLIWSDLGFFRRIIYCTLR